VSIKQLAAAADEISAWLKWDSETLELFQTYAQRFKWRSAGANVYMLVLEDALLSRGVTLEQFKYEVEHKANDVRE